MQHEVDLQNQMILDATLILKSVDFTEKEYNSRMKELEEACESFDYPRADVLRLEILALLKKLNHEVAEMDAYMEKYGKQIKKSLNHEKKKSLSDSRKKEQIHLRGVRANPRG
jgi:galactokinase